ncbi:MAG: hypothetical protein ACJATT_005585 [Myxococcota bacterium]|jgi:hypothetical protein
MHHWPEIMASLLLNEGRPRLRASPYACVRPGVTGATDRRIGSITASETDKGVRPIFEHHSEITAGITSVETHQLQVSVKSGHSQSRSSRISALLTTHMVSLPAGEVLYIEAGP